MAQKLALLGGTPIRKRHFPSWPIFGKPEEKRLLKTLRSGKWGRLHGHEVAEFERRFAKMHGCKHALGGESPGCPCDAPTRATNLWEGIYSAKAIAE